VNLLGFNLDEDALMAAADLVGRTGAREFQIGFTNDDDGITVAEMGWYCHAQYQGTRIIEEGAGPVEAAEALARRLLSGAKCKRCGKLVALSDDGAVAWDSVALADGTTWTVEEARAAGQCRWTRMGRTWVSACGAGQPPAATTSAKSTSPQRSQRRGKRPKRKRRRG
jgi:hypothetical protein